MTPAQEKKILTDLVARMDGKRAFLFDSPRSMLLLWALFCVGFTLVMILGGTWGHLGVAFAFAMLGAAVGIGAVAREAVNREPVVRPHVDRASVERRLQELDAP